MYEGAFYVKVMKVLQANDPHYKSDRQSKKKLKKEPKEILVWNFGVSNKWSSVSEIVDDDYDHYDNIDATKEYDDIVINGRYRKPIKTNYQKQHKQLKLKIKRKITDCPQIKTERIASKNSIYSCLPSEHCLSLTKFQLAKKEVKKVWSIYDIRQRQKYNIERNIEKSGFKRLENYACLDYSAAFLSTSKRKRTQAKSAQSTGACNLPLGTIIIESLKNLQYREVGPEDYELLLSLDTLVKPKVATKRVLQNLTSVSQVDLNEKCAVCLGDMLTTSQLIKLPKCGHWFHAECINAWLSRSADTCPIDKIEV